MTVTLEQFEDNTCLMPNIIADNIITDICLKTGAEFEHSLQLNEFLCKRTVDTYNSNKSFNKKLHGKKSREWLYFFMKHWAAGWLKTNYPNTHARLPDGYGWNC